MIIRTSIVHATILLSLAFILDAKPRRTKAQHIQNKQLINAAASGNYEKVKHLLETNAAKINEMSHLFLPILYTKFSNWPQGPFICF